MGHSQPKGLLWLATRNLGGWGGLKDGQNTYIKSELTSSITLSSGPAYFPSWPEFVDELRSQL